MGSYWRVMGRYNAETQAYSAFAGAGLASPFTPAKDGRLIGIRIIVGSEAATSLTEGVLIKLTCTKWTPNVMEFAVQGNGIRTAPAAKTPVYDFVCDQPVSESSPITLEGQCVEATHVTNSVYVLGQFV